MPALSLKVILDNLDRKFNAATTNARNAAQNLRSYAAEEIRQMLEDRFVNFTRSHSTLLYCILVSNIART
jgi:vacuolar-type H+-ATPase subunit E/Vma4